MLGALVALAATCHVLPDLRPDAGEPVARGPLWRLLRQPAFVVFLLIAAAVQSSHALYYAFGTLHWRAAGHDEGAIGWLWAEGVIAEIALFAAAPVFARRLGPLGLLALGALAGVVRWSVTACTTDYVALLLVQPLHAFTYGATHMGAVSLIATRVAPGAAATAQSLYGGIANGAAMGLVLLAGGPLFAALGGRAFWAMAVLAALGGLGVLALARHERHSATGRRMPLR
jgi:PPP family 3-phenylpropionic acid transporter